MLVYHSISPTLTHWAASGVSHISWSLFQCVPNGHSCSHKLNWTHIKKRVQSLGCGWNDPSAKQDGHSLLGGVLVGIGVVVVISGSSTQSTNSARLQCPIVRSNNKPFEQVRNDLLPITHSMNWLQNCGCGKFWMPNGEQFVHVELLQVWLIASNNNPCGHLSPRIVCPFIQIMYASHDNGDATKLCWNTGAPRHGWLPCTTQINVEAKVYKSASEISNYEIN